MAADAQAAPSGGIIGWFAANHVAANLLMIFIIVGGGWGLLVVKKESFPEFNFGLVTVTVPYLGAAPQEVEEGVIVKIEEAVQSIEGVREVESVATEGVGQVFIEVEEGYDAADVTDEVKLAVDGISTFPAETERPLISRQRFNKDVLNLQVHGDLSETAMKLLTEQIRDEVTALPEVSHAEAMGTRPFEIAVEIPEQTLREYGLTLDAVAQAIRGWSIDLPGGAIRTASGDIRLRAKGQAYTGAQFAEIVLLTRPDGTRVRLGDIASIQDGFAEVDSYSYFDGQPSFGIRVMSTNDESEIAVSEAIHEYVEQRRATLPEGVQLTAWGDATYYLKGRMNMMVGNMALGAMLVFVILGLFLRMKIAGWVIVGLPVAFLGAFMMLPAPFVDVSVNIMSLFAFILVLGIVVDDAIIIAESAYTCTEERGYSLNSIVAGARRVAVPATFGVLTTIMAFLPMLLVTGVMSSVNRAIGWVVVFCLLFSLVESKLILPSHLAAMRSSGGTRAGMADWVDRGLKRFTANVYAPWLAKAIEFRYATVAFFVGLLILTAGLVFGGLARFVFFPEFDMDFLRAEVKLQEGAPESLIRDIVEKLDADLRTVNEEVKAETGIDRNVAEHLFAYIRDGRHGHIQVELDKGEHRTITPKEVEVRWREKVGEIAGTEELRFMSSRQMGGGSPIAFALTGTNHRLVEQASEDLLEHLRGYDGLFEVRSNAQGGPEEIKLRVKPEAEALGVTLAALARQVREAFYGAEAQRIQRGNQEVRVMVRYPRADRASLGNLESMWIRLPDGRELPFDAVATYEIAQGYNALHRLDGRSAITVEANANLAVVEQLRVSQQVADEFMPALLARYPGVAYELAGSSREERSSLALMGYAFMAALFGIYALMAIPLRSYVQPLLIMSVIPFGIIGAVVGHMLLGLTINAVSIIGIIALSGVVVNDSLIMVDFVNKAVARGASPAQAAVESGAARLRAILLTSLTTFFGLVPMVFETSMQAQMVIPMAVSLAFGILFATVITLVLVPCLYNIVNDMRAGRRADSANPALAEAGAIAGGR